MDKMSKILDMNSLRINNYMSKYSVPIAIDKTNTKGLLQTYFII